MAQGVDEGVNVSVGGTGVLVTVLAVVGVLLGVNVRVGTVDVTVGVGVLVTGVPVVHGGWLKASCIPWVVLPPLPSHSYWMNRLPVPFWAPTVALPPVSPIAPYTKSKRLCPSYSLAS